MKKFLAILLSTVLVVSMLAVIAPASAASNNVALNAKYTISGSGKADEANWNAKLTDGVASDDLGDGRWVNTWFSLGEAHKDASNYASVVIDLGAVYNITEVKIHFGNSGDGGVSSGENSIRVSEDGENWTLYGEAFATSDIAVGSTDWRGVAQSATARYVKFQLNIWATWSTFFNEIEVYADGEVKPEPTPEGDNLAKGLTVKHSLADGSFTDAASGDWNADLTDGKYFKAMDESVWTNGGNATWFGLKSDKDITADNYAYLSLDLGEVATINTVRIFCGGGNWGVEKPYEVYLGTSTNGTDYSWISLNDSLQDGCYWLSADVNADAQYIQYKIYLHGSWAFFNELEVYGEAAGSSSNDESSEAPVESSEDVAESETPAESSEDAAESETPAESSEDAAESETPAESSETVAESSQEESKKPSTPAAGDASNMLMFAVIALVAIAGSAVVIKTRR